MHARTLLKVSGLSRHFGAEPVLSDVSFTVVAGERVGLVGENGVGKSTLLRALVGDLAPDRGHVLVPPGVEVGYLPQDLALPAGTSVDALLRRAGGRLDELAEEMRRIELLLGSTDGPAYERAL